MMLVYLSLLVLFLTVAAVAVWRLSSTSSPRPRPNSRLICLPPTTSARGGSFTSTVTATPHHRDPEVIDSAQSTALIPADRNLAVSIDKRLLEVHGKQTGGWSFWVERARMQNAVELVKLKLELVQVGGDVAITTLDKQIATQSRKHMLEALEALADLETEFQRAQTELAISTLRLKQQEIFDRIDRLAATGQRGTSDGGSSTRSSVSTVFRNGAS